MRTGLLCIAASTVLATGAVLAQTPGYLPTLPGDAPERDTVISGTPVLLPATPEAIPPAADSGLTGGSTGLRPGIDGLPDPSLVCRQKSRLYADAAYLVMWFQQTTPPPLIGVAPPFVIGPPVPPGGIVLPVTAVLFGGTDTDLGGYNAARVTVGYWLDPRQTWGIEAGGLLTEQRADRFVATHDGSATNVALGRVDFTAPGLVLGPLVGTPRILAGSETVTQNSQLWTAEGNVVYNWRDSGRSRVELLGGFRYMDLRERLTVRDDTQSLLFATTVLARTDDFATRNQFYGGQVGSRTVFTFDRLSLSLVGKLALGATFQVVDRNAFVDFGGASFAGGYLVPPGNIGRDTTDRFAVMSESTIQVGYRLTQRLETFVGYELLYLSSAARPADQIFDTGSAFGPLATGIPVADFYAQGVQLGMTYKW